MSRYEILLTDSTCYYIKNTVLLLSKSALTKDNEKDAVLVQLKLRSLYEKRIVALEVLVTGMDLEGNAIEEKSKQNITIVTKNDDSQSEIKDRIREMDVDVQRLFEQSHLEFIITDEKRSQERLNDILIQMNSRRTMKGLLSNK